MGAGVICPSAVIDRISLCRLRSIGVSPGSATLVQPTNAIGLRSSMAPDRQQRACINCARSKTKCVWRSEGETRCERCSKGALECAMPEWAPRKKRGKSNRVKTLEQKVESIMTMLSTNERSPSAANWHHPETPRRVGGYSATPPTIPEAPLPQMTAQTPCRTASSLEPEQHVDIVPGFSVSLPEAAQLLNEYRTEMLPAFPFCPVPNMGARQMLQEQPLLLKAIINSCRPPLWPLKGVVNEWFRSHLAHRIVVVNEKSLEHLQTILLLIAWNDWQFTIAAHNSSLLQLAVGLVGDLGLNRRPEDQVTPAKSIADDAQVQIRGFNIRREPTNAGRRAFLGTFYLGSILGTVFRRTEPPNYSDYIDQCCRELCEADEYPTDHLAAALARIQRPYLRAVSLSQSYATGIQSTFGIPYEMAYATIHKELDGMVRGQPEKVMQSYIVWGHYHMALIRLYEPAIFMEPDASEVQTNARTRGLWAYFQNAKALLELSLTVPAEAFATHTIAFVAHISCGNHALTRALLLEDRDWDIATAREMADYPGLTDRLSIHFEAAHQHWCSKRPAAPYGKGPFLRLAERMKWAKGWYLSKVSPDPPMTPTMWDESIALGEFEDGAWLSLLDGSLDADLMQNEP